MSLTAVVEALVEAGATPQMILAAVRASEGHADAAIAARRANDAARQQKRREKRSGHVTSRDVTVTDRDPPLETKGVPEPLPKTQNPTTPPIVPPASRKIPGLAEQIWAMQPVKHRRSTRPDVAEALRGALKRGGDPEMIRLAVAAYYDHPDSRKDEGAFAKGAAVLLAKDRWRDFLPHVEPPKTFTPAARAQQLQHFRATGEWRQEWGDQPEEQAA